MTTHFLLRNICGRFYFTRITTWVFSVLHYFPEFCQSPQSGGFILLPTVNLESLWLLQPVEYGRSDATWLLRLGHWKVTVFTSLHFYLFLSPSTLVFGTWSTHGDVIWSNSVQWPQLRFQLWDSMNFQTCEWMNHQIIPIPSLPAVSFIYGWVIHYPMA